MAHRTQLEIASQQETVDHLEINSLAEHLYNYFSMAEVLDLITQQPEPYSLIAWNLSMDQYVQQINTAIEFIQND